MSLLARITRRSPWLRLGAASSLAVLSLSCAKGNPTTPDGDPFPIPPEEAGAETGTFVEAGTAEPKESDVECTQETKQIYVVATDKVLYRFYPETLKFVKVGTLGCETGAGTFSMAIDRRGKAWVEFTDGRIFGVSTSDASCKATAFMPGQTGFTNFGMGYAKNGDSANGETLYLSGDALGSLDTKTFEITFLGSLTYGRTELTSLDTALYAFSPTSGVIADLNKANGATNKVYRTSAINADAAFAFAQWGGDFYVFTGNTTSVVTRYSPFTDDSTVVVPDTGMLIVGAGSSTCAPTTRPR